MGKRQGGRRLDERRAKHEHKGWRTRLPRLLSLRRGPYRLPRVFAGRLLSTGADRGQYGPEISLRDLTDRFSYDCVWRAEAWSKRGKSACGVYLPDLANPRPLICRRGS